MWEHTSSGAVYLVCNGIRPCTKHNALDQEPFGIVVHSTGSSERGIFVHHGNSKKRTVDLPVAVKNIFESTSFDKYYPLAEIPKSSSGILDELKNTSHEGAFRKVISTITRST